MKFQPCADPASDLSSHVQPPAFDCSSNGLRRFGWSRFRRLQQADELRRKLWRTACVLGLLAAVVPYNANIAARAYAQRGRSAVVVFSQSVSVGGATLQIDFGEGPLDLPRADVVQRIQQAAHSIEVFYGRFPVPRARILVLPVAGRHGVLQGTTWGGVDGWPSFMRLRLGQSTTHEELADDWIITHELAHTALSDLPDDQHWLEEGLASYVEPLARAQVGELDAKQVWAGMVDGMPNGEPDAGDRGLNNTHSWGRTYWGGALFCLMADVQIRRQTGNRKGLQDALRGIVAAGATIDTDWPVDRVLRTGDQATGTHVLEEMYKQWGETPVNVDLPSLWRQLGVKDVQGAVTFDAAAPLAGIRVAMTSPLHNSNH
jgi:hypothetical protein